MERGAFVCCLALVCFGCSHGTWVVKPENGNVRAWKRDIAPLFPQGLCRHLPPITFLTAYGSLLTVSEVKAADGAFFLVHGDWRGHLLLLSPKTGRTMRQWNLRWEMWNLPRRVREGTHLLEDSTLFERSLFGYCRPNLVQWKIGSSDFARTWELGRGTGPHDLQRVGDWLVVPLMGDGRRDFHGIDLNRGSIEWQTCVELPASIKDDTVHARAMGVSAETAHWEMATSSREECVSYVAVDAPTGTVLDVTDNMPPHLLARPAYSAHFDRASQRITLLRQQQVAQKRRESGEAVWRGEFSEQLRPLGMFALEEDRIFVEFEILLNDPTTRGELVGTYTLHGPSGPESHAVKAPLANFPLRGAAAVDLASGELLWARTVSAADLGIDPDHVWSATSRRKPVGSSWALDQRLTREGPLTVGTLVIMRPLTFSGNGDRHYHCMVGLDVGTGSIAFIHRTSPVTSWHGEAHVYGFAATDSAVCFNTGHGTVYGLDLSEVIAGQE